jgi:hypothetical protein
MIQSDRGMFSKVCRNSLRRLADPKCKVCHGSGSKGRLTVSGVVSKLRCRCTTTHRAWR